MGSIDPILERLKSHEYELGTLMALGASIDNPLFFDTADPDLDTPAHVKQALIEAVMEKGYTHYARIRGLEEFVTSVAQFYQRFEVHVDPLEEVMATVGSGEGLYIVIRSTIGEGDEVILPHPTFPTYASLLHLVGGRPRYVPCTTDFHLDLEAIGKAVSRRTKAIILCTPNNPTGAVYTQEELQGVLNIAAEHDLMLISDENYSLLTYDGRTHRSIASLPGAMERTFVVSGVSKAHAMTGWRLGYVIAKRESIAQLEKLAFNIHGAVNTAVQYAGAAALGTPDPVMEQIVRTYDERRHLMVEGLRLAGLECHIPEGGFEAFPQIPEKATNSMEFTKTLAQTASVLVKPGIFFGPLGDRFVRLVYCKSPGYIKEGLERIKKALS